MKVIRLLSRFIPGIIFIFSGFVKAIDPLGFTYKFHDYFHAFSLGFLDPVSLPLAILMCTAEFIAGFSLLTGIRIRDGIWIALILMIIFTPLTLILAITNPVSDCGCFGDAVHLTNWQTFGKNVIMIIPVIFLFCERKKILPPFGRITELLSISAVSTIFIGFSLYNLRYLPVIDFLPYKVGARIADLMVVPEGSEPDLYNTTFIYEKDGIKKEFTLSNYPSNDTTWKFIDQKTVLVKKGTQPKIHDFSIYYTGGEDITSKILGNEGWTVLMISKKLSEANNMTLKNGFEFGSFCSQSGIDFYVVTATNSEEVKKYMNGLVFCTADETTLKTIVRANPGYLLLKDGVIMGKWSSSNLPDKEWFSQRISLTLGSEKILNNANATGAY